MASSKEYLQFILEQLSDLEDINYRAMMGEYIIYYRERIVGGIYDDRLLVKPTKSAVSYMVNAIYELPYEGAKEMLLVENIWLNYLMQYIMNKPYPIKNTPRMIRGVFLIGDISALFLSWNARWYTPE